MKTKIHAFFLCALTVLFAVSAGWAADRTLDFDAGTYYINMPANGTDKLTVTDADIADGLLFFRVYDDGGASGSYSNDAAGFLEITVPEGFRIKISGDVSVGYYEYDFLTIYEGSINGTAILNEAGKYTSSSAFNISPLTSSGNTVLLYFKTDGSGQNSGLNLLVQFYEPDAEYQVQVNSAVGGSVTSSQNIAGFEDTISLSINPDEGYLLDGIVVEYGNGARVETDVKWYSNTTKFVMPASDVSVTPTFREGFSGLYVNVPSSDTIAVTIPNGMTSLKIYDDGGSENNPESYANGAVQLTAPEGSVLRVTGTVSTYGTYGHLYIYDGDAEATLLLDASSSGWNGDNTEITPTASSGRTMTIRFASGYVNSLCTGIDLTVTTEDASVSHTVSTPDIEGVDVAGVGNYTAGQEVSLVFTPNVDLKYTGIDIRYANDLSLDATILTDENGVTTVTFMMPYSDVTVSPTFSALYAVSVATVSFGSVTSDETSAIAGSTVTLTAIPDNDAEFVRVNVLGSNDGSLVDVSRNGNTVTFTMPDQAVMVTPVFAKPSVVTFDENGCLTNGTYFHLVCDGSECILSQVPVENPDEGVTDFRCWYLGTAWEEDVEKGLVDHIIEQEFMGMTLKLGSTINLGGYDSENSKCAMANFEPISLSMEASEGEFDGQNNTVSGFCYEPTTGTSGGFVTGAISVQNVTFENARVVVNNAARGSIAGVVAAEMSGDETNTISSVRVVNSYVAGTQAGAIVGRITGEASVSNSSAIDTKVYGLNLAATQGVSLSVVGGLVGQANADISFLQDTVKVTAANAGVVADDDSYTEEGGSYRGGLVGYVSGENAAFSVTNCHVSGLSVSGSGNSNVGAVAGQISALSMLNTKLEDISVSGANAGGAVGQVVGEFFNVTMTTDTVAGTSAVAGRTNAGGLVGYVELSSTAGAMTTSLNYLTVMADVSGGNSAGGLVGEILVSSEVGSTLSVEHVSVAGSVGATKAGMTAAVSVGGLFGKVAMGTMNPSTLTVSANSFSGDVSFTNTGAERALYMGSLLGYVDVANLTIYGNYSSGDITYSGVTGGNANVGYLCGYVDVSNYTPKIFGNYHYGEDEVATGLGNVVVATWTAGDDSYFANARNATGSLTASEGFGFHLYEVDDGDNEIEAMDMFAANVSETAFARVRNGVVSEDDMKSGMFAALMNHIPSRSVALNTFVWIGQDGELPRVATPIEKTSYLLPLAVLDVSMLSPEQKEAMGFRAVDEHADLTGSTPVVTSVYEGFVGYTDADGHANKMFVDSLQAVVQALESSGYAPYLVGEGLQTTMITGSTVFNDGVEMIGVMTDQTLKTYDVVYKSCSGTATITCEDFTAGSLYFFMSPLVDKVTNGEDSYKTLIPHRIAQNDGTNNSWLIRYVTAGGTEIETDYMDSFKTFHDAIAHMPSDEEITTIVVGFYDLSFVNPVSVKNPSLADFNLEVYGYTDAAEGTKGLIDTKTVTSSDNEIAMEYGSSFAAKDFAARVGYTYDSYAVSFTVSNPNEDRCNDVISVGTVDVEDKFFAPWEELATLQDNCTSKTWMVSGLTPADTISLEQVELAKVNAATASYWKEEFAIIPKYNANPYTLTFNFDGNLVQYGEKYDVFVDNSYQDLATPVTLDDENKTLPMIYGQQMKLLGWVLDESKGNCIYEREGCLGEVEYNYGGFLFTEFTPELITAADGASSIQLYPVWTEASGDDYRRVAVSTCLKAQNNCYEYPIEFTLSQDRTMGGNPVRFTAYSDRQSDPYNPFYGVKLYTHEENEYEFKVAVQATPGFTMSNVRANGYDASTGMLMVNEDVSFAADYTILKYDVKFNLENLIQDAFLGNDWEYSRRMSVEMSERQPPKAYARSPQDDEVVYSPVVWGVKTAEGYVNGDDKFTSKMVGVILRDDNEYYTPAVDEDTPAKSEVFGVDGQIINLCSSSWAHADSIEVEVDETDGGLSGFHGSIVLTQTYDNDEAGIHWVFEHAFRELLYVPNYDDTLSFSVSARPDPGYVMVIEPEFSYQNSWEGSVTTGGAIAWGYDSDNGKLVIQPYYMNSMKFKVKFSRLGYNVAFSRLDPQSGVFVGNRSVDDALQIDWLESADAVNAETAHAPALFDGRGCRIGWKLEGTTVDSRTSALLADELPTLVSMQDDAAAVNVLEPDLDNPVCDGTEETYRLRLDVDGEGEVYFIQKIGDEPVGNEDPEQTVITHAFVSAGDDQPLTLSVPKIVDATGREVGVKLTVVAVPADGYVLNTLSYDVMFNGNSVTVLAQDSTELNITENQDWHVKFEQYKPVYVTYDLSLGEEDSSNVWIPADAVVSGSLQIGADGSDAPMWIPFRTDKCFAGWSTNDPNGAQPDVNVLFKEVSVSNLDLFSHDAAAPTKLYASWVDYTGYCSWPRNTLASINLLRYYEDINDEESYRNMYEDTLLVIQRFANVEFKHKAWMSPEFTELTSGPYSSDPLKFVYNPSGYEMSFEILPGLGKKVDPDDPAAKLVVSFPEDIALVEGENGWFTVPANEDSHFYFVGYKEIFDDYDFVLSPNAGEGEVVYGENWSKNATIRIDGALPAGNVFRTDACFAGWAYEPEAPLADAIFDKPLDVRYANTELLTKRNERLASGLNVDTLYAMWDASQPGCRSGILYLDLDAAILDLATVSFFQNVDGVETKVLEVGSDGASIPFGAKRSSGNITNYIGDNIYFTRVEVTPKPGVTLAQNYTVSYVNVSDADAEEHALPTVAGGAETLFDDNIIISVTGLSRNDYTVAYHENAGDAPVFYGEHWAASATYGVGDTLSESVYRTDKCLAGWTFDVNSADGLVYKTLDADFIGELEMREIEGDIDLYAVWSDDNAACESPIRNVVVTLSDELQGKATVELLQDVEGETRVAAVVGDEGVSIPKVTTRAVDINGNTEYLGEFLYFSGLRVVPATGYALDNTVNPSYKVGDEAEVEMTAEPQPWYMTEDAVVSAAVSAVSYELALDENANGANVFYRGEPLTSVTLKVTDEEASRTLPANLYRSDACFVGWSFSESATTGFSMFDADVILAYEEAGTSTLYAVWDASCQQTLYTVTSADKGKGVLTLAQGTRSFEVGDGLKVPAVEDGLEFVASFAPATGYTYDADANFAILDANGVSLGELEDGALSVNQTVSVKALGLAESEYTIAFNVNAGDVPVYYGTPAEGAAPAYTYKVAEPEAFPIDFYRTDACLTGWRATEAPVEGETLFHEFDAAFVEAVAEIPSYTGTLYAVWGTCATTNNVTVAQAASEMGTLSLVQRDADGEVINSTEVKDEAVTLPLGKGDITFAVEFTPNPGYSKVANSYFYTVDANGNNLAALVNDKLTLAGNTIVKAPAKADAFAVAFDVNAATGVNVFYGSGWNASGSYDISMSESERAFPTEVYRVGYKLVGWSLAKIADGAAVYYSADGGPSGYENTYQIYDEKSSEALKASGSSTVTMYAVWMPDADQSTYAVSLSNPNAGSLTLSQDVSGAQEIEVGADELLVPSVQGGLVFHVSAMLNSGYFANGSSLNLVDSEGNVLGSLQNGILVVDEDKTLEIPVEADGVQFVFVENTRARVFYENGWNNKGFFALDGETDFPRGLLRTDAELLGWAFSRNGTKYYKKYDERFVVDLRNARSIGLPVDTLYAVWDEYATVDKEFVKSEGDRTGSFFISQTVNDMTTEPIEVTAAGIEIPRSEKGITFNVTYEVIPGYRIDSESAITKSDVTGEVLGSTANGGSLVMGQEQSLSLGASVAAIPYRFTYDVNGGDANVFYGDGWFSSDEKTLDDESVALPNNIYRADAKLVGWSFDSDASEGSFDLTSDLVRDVSVSNEVRTLYAVWEPAEVETYTVSFANTNVGSLVLTQDVEDTTVSFTVADSGLVVPVVQGGLKFKAAYTLKAGFSGSTDSLYVVDDISGLLTSLADGELTVAEDVTLAIPTEGETFDVVFHANRDKDVLFYGSDWKNSASYKLDDSTVSIPLPAYLYTASACMVGWSLDSKGEGEAYTEFSSELADALLSLEKTDAYDLYAVWGSGEACDDMYNRVALQSANGTVKLVEIAEQREIEHEFAKDNTIILPKTVNGNMLRVVSEPDSSFVLDSLVMVRLGGDERLATFEGGVLPFNLAEASLVAYFGKANRTDIEFVKPVVTQAGNAVQFAFATSEFEVTRKVSARVILETEAGESVADTVIADSIVPPYSGVWQMFPLSADKYVLTALLYDSKDTVETSERFEVKAEIAAVAEDGWQMISLVNLDKDAMKWDDDDAKFYWWDESSSMGDFWQYREYSPEDEIEPTRGYWYSSLEGRPLVLKPATDESVMDNVVWNLDSINSGWNLVANPYGFNLNVYGDRPNENLDAAEKAEVNFWRWNPDAGRYEPAVVIKPYEAVWAEVHHSMEWVLPVKPDFTSRDTSGLDSLESPLSKRFLAKATSNRDWRLQAILSDKKGKVDSWNILGASTRPFVAKEPPAGMGDHVNLSIVDGERMLATSVRAPADELEWSVELSATSDRVGELSFKGVESLREVGLKVFVTVDGKTTEMHGGETLRVELGAFAKKATVRVAPAAKVVASFSIDALRYVKSGAIVGVTFEASDGLAGSRTVVDILDMGGKVVSSRSATTLAGVNQLVLDAPKPGLYMLRVRAGSQMKAGRIVVK